MAFVAFLCTQYRRRGFLRSSPREGVLRRSAHSYIGRSSARSCTVTRSVLTGPQLGLRREGPNPVDPRAGAPSPPPRRAERWYLPRVRRPSSEPARRFAEGPARGRPPRGV